MKTIPTLRTTLRLAVLSAIPFLASCEKKEGGETSEGEASIDPAVEAIFLETSPEGAVTVTEARQSAKPGDEITVSGKVAGTMKPFVDGYASLVLADRALETCDMIPGDECPTPWDACCVAPEKIKASRLTLQVLDGNGQPVATTLEGVRGLAELDPLVVKGVVAEGSNEENLVVNVTGLFLDEKAP